jgi:hypothetical protein
MASVARFLVGSSYQATCDLRCRPSLDRTDCISAEWAQTLPSPNARGRFQGASQRPILDASRGVFENNILHYLPLPSARSLPTFQPVSAEIRAASR